MFRWLIAFLILAAAAAGLIFFVAGRSAPPTLVINKPDHAVGRTGTVEISAGAPGAKFRRLTISLQQNGQTIPLFSLDPAAPRPESVTQIDGDHLRISRPLGKESVPALQQGSARIVVEATRASFLNLRMISSTASKDVQVKLDPPRIAVVSTHHYVNHGGSEMVVYRATPPDVTSGVRVGTVEYKGYQATGAGVANADAALRVAFFALLYDQELSLPIVVFARDEAGNEVTAPFVDNVFEKPFKKSRIEIDDKFLQRVVPEILAHSPELKADRPDAAGDLLPGFLRINGELRRLNTDRIAALAAATATSRFWKGPFVQLGNSKVEAGFADHRTYIYQGKEIDQQVHLGFDLAVTSAVTVVAANAGVVINASWLGIFGNCIIIDHGMGVASLYGHLSSIGVNVGDLVKRDQPIGKSGMTGLAGGDHLHFTMLVGGHAVNPVEWWDPHWIQDRVDRKLQEAGGSSTAAP